MRALVDPDAAAVEALARLQLAARRRGQRLELQGAPHRLRELVEFMGLTEALGIKARWKFEQRKQRFRVEEERELEDPAGGQLHYL